MRLIGRIIRAVGELDDEEMNIVLSLEVDMLNSWGQCMMFFSPENSVKVLQSLKEPDEFRVIIDKLKGKKVQLFEHPKGGTLAPIAIACPNSNQWIFKKGFDQKCNGKPNDDDYLSKTIGRVYNETE